MTQDHLPNTIPALIQVTLYLATSIAVQNAIPFRLVLDRLTHEALPECSNHFRKPVSCTLSDRASPIIINTHQNQLRPWSIRLLTP